ncbi:hypothetical protein P3X46_028100 [Hevea brasiliensis]|uniref:FYVE-type domain-containing protein n=1 Tax=Hevea brasiliensis TaxID=3981 RepID=A0ABQ9KQX9_HEVBR|nr:uncharacterized protein LOC131174577 [Hevea brasiliensis]KAJ9145755.1 hypothetical protein P3X46_028100 [Hevea brasiliensis]
MGDLKSVAKARLELEELYLGIPDDSVNLTFQDLANVKENANIAEKKKSTTMETIQEGNKSHVKQASPPNRLPSLDFKLGLQESKNHHAHHHLDDADYEGHKFECHRSPGKHHHHHRLHHDVDGMHVSRGHHRYGYDDHHPSHHRHAEFKHAVENSGAYDDMSIMSMNSTYQERGGRSRRPGIPHSNICAVCSTYIYIFRNRCLVCGRVYCKTCVSIGMGDMTEGRKCIQCLGKKFSHRYIERAGKVGCCSRHPSSVKQAELRWAEKGPRITGEKAYGHSTMVSRSRSPMNPRIPTRPHVNNSPPSFVSSSSTYSPYSANHHHLPL